jgi:tetratricopeptide (TPR) repeat protein
MPALSRSHNFLGLLVLGNQDLQKGRYQEALTAYRRIITQSKPFHREYVQALYSIGCVYMALHKDSEAVVTYLKIVRHRGLICQCGDDGRASRSLDCSYRHWACKKITDAYIEMSKYDSALYYLKLLERWPYSIALCAQSCDGEKQEIDYDYALTYLGEKDTGKALHFLLQNTFQNQFLPAAFLLQKALELLWKKYPAYYLIGEYYKASSHFYLKHVPLGHSMENEYFIRYLGIEIPLFVFSQKNENSSMALKRIACSPSLKTFYLEVGFIVRKEMDKYLPFGATNRLGSDAARY